MASTGRPIARQHVDDVVLWSGAKPAWTQVSPAGSHWIHVAVGNQHGVIGQDPVGIGKGISVLHGMAQVMHMYFMHGQVWGRTELGQSSPHGRFVNAFVVHQQVQAAQVWVQQGTH